MEQRLLVIAFPVDVFDADGGPLAERIEPAHVEAVRSKHLGARHRLPHSDEVGLAARFRSDQQLDAVRPIRPGIDQADGGAIAVAHEKVFGAERRAVWQIEDELFFAHEAPACDCPGPFTTTGLLAMGLLWRTGRGGGSGS